MFLTLGWVVERDYLCNFPLSIKIYMYGTYLYPVCLRRSWLCNTPHCMVLYILYINYDVGQKQSCILSFRRGLSNIITSKHCHGIIQDSCTSFQLIEWSLHILYINYNVGQQESSHSFLFSE